MCGGKPARRDAPGPGVSGSGAATRAGLSRRGVGHPPLRDAFPVEVIRRTLGLAAENTRAISLPPPFPRENRKIMILPQVRTAFAHRARNYAPIARLIAEMADAQPGNALVLFPAINSWTRWRRYCQSPARGG